MDFQKKRKSATFGSDWWKFDRYEVVDGTHIAPAEDAELIRHDPLEAHRDRWKGGSEEASPYLDLARLDIVEVEEILEWCNRYGLLGVLPHRTLAVYFWPTWGGAISTGGWGGVARTAGFDDAGGFGGGLDADGVVEPEKAAVQSVYRWGQGGGWEEISVPGSPDEPSRSDEQPVPSEARKTGSQDRSATGDAPVESLACRVGERLTPEKLERVQGRTFWKGQPLRPPGARIRRLQGAGVEWTSFAEGYAQFFPRRPLVSAWVAGRYTWPETPGPTDNPFRERKQTGRFQEAQLELERNEYPKPDEKAFLREYGEPIPLLKRYIRQVQRAYEVWEEVEETESYEELLPALRSVHGEGTRHPVFEEFRASLEVVSPNAIPEREGDGFRWPLRWHVPSQYAALSVMMLEDFTQREVKAKRCRNCNRRFTTRKTNQKYCSDRCGNQYRVRKHRQKQESADDHQ